jgi:allantoin racemase
MQGELGVPVIDAVLSPFKLAESLGESAVKFGWRPSRKGGSEPPPEEEASLWGLAGEPPVGALLRFADIPADG